MVRFSNDGSALGGEADTADGVRPGEPAKPLSPAMLDWMRHIQEGGVRMATDEEYRKAIAARLF